MLSGIELELAPGELFGITGENGTGKSTPLRILAGELAADRGGHHLRRQRRLLSTEDRAQRRAHRRPAPADLPKGLPAARAGPRARAGGAARLRQPTADLPTYGSVQNAVGAAFTGDLSAGYFLLGLLWLAAAAMLGLVAFQRRTRDHINRDDPPAPLPVRTAP